MSGNSANSIPPPLNDLLVKLKILSMVERGKKINMNTMTFTDAGSWVGSLTRSLNGESRKGLMVHLKSIVQQAVEAITEYQNTEYCKLIVNELARAKVGIQTLMTTYQSDPNIVSEIEVCITNITMQLNRNASLLDGHPGANAQPPPYPRPLPPPAKESKSS